MISLNLAFTKLSICLSIIFLMQLPAFNSQILAQNSTIPGELSSPYPTILNLAVDWTIQGDENQNCIVNMQFREKGFEKWENAMPLRRIPAGEMAGLNNTKFKWGNKLSGSIFDLKPDTEYEIKLKLEDPDGGNAEKIITSRTRPVPAIGKNAEIIDVQPGKYDTLYTVSGSPEKPRVYHCSRGEATYTYIDLQNKKWVFIDGFIINNTNPRGKGVNLMGAENCVVQNCTINAVYGIVAYRPGATNCYISDNILTGTSVWTNEAMGAHGDNIGEGIQITGPGNVICYNRVTGFRDCISTMEDQGAVNQICIDIYNNDIFTGADDGIEADFCFSNCRIFRNRLTNCFVGLSSQPGLGGPTYFMRNAMYNIIHAAFKLKRFSQGDVVLHNTVIKIGAGLAGNSAMDYAYFRNNLAIGGPKGDINWGDYGAGNPFAADIVEPGIHSSFDYDAVGVYGIDYIAKIGNLPFSRIEKHGVEQIDLEKTFTNVKFPNPPVPERNAPDLRPKAGSKVEDAAEFIPNVNNNFNAKAPDCGAYEIGEALPHYGPRPAVKY